MVKIIEFCGDYEPLGLSVLPASPEGGEAGHELRAGVQVAWRASLRSHLQAE